MATGVDLNGIKEEIRSILSTANTTTASPIDLSYNISDSVRVRNILKVHPELLRPQASAYPLVTCYVPSKQVISSDIAKDQLNSKRRARVSVEIVGALYNDNYKEFEEDPADEDINQLMENVELILRSNPNLNAKVIWQRPSGVAYYSTSIDEETHLRAGILTLECEVFY